MKHNKRLKSPVNIRKKILIYEKDHVFIVHYHSYRRWHTTKNYERIKGGQHHWNGFFDD